MRRVTRCSWLIIGVAVALTPTLAAETAMSTTRVTVSDVGVDPVEACVRKGGKVLWVNTGARSHRITVDQRTWPAFTLAAGKSKSITFARIGTRPYRMDGTAVGVVNVRTTCAAPAGSGGATPGTGTGTVPVAPGTRFVTYDVEVRGSLIQKGTAENGGLLAYQLDRTMEWTGTFRRVRIEVRNLPNGGFVANLGAPTFFVDSTERFTIRSRVLYQAIFNPAPPSHLYRGGLDRSSFQAVCGPSGNDLERRDQ